MLTGSWIHVPPNPAFRLCGRHHGTSRYTAIAPHHPHHSLSPITYHPCRTLHSPPLPCTHTHTVPPTLFAHITFSSPHLPKRHPTNDPSLLCQRLVHPCKAPPSYHTHIEPPLLPLPSTRPPKVLPPAPASCSCPEPPCPRTLNHPLSPAFPPPASPRYFPLRLRLVRALNRLSQSTGFYTPVCPLLLEVLGWAELKRRPAGGTAGAPDLLLLLRLSKTQLRSAALQEEVVNQVGGGGRAGGVSCLVWGRKGREGNAMCWLF